MSKIANAKRTPAVGCSALLGVGVMTRRLLYFSEALAAASQALRQKSDFDLLCSKPTSPTPDPEGFYTWIEREHVRIQGLPPEQQDGELQNLREAYNAHAKHCKKRDDKRWHQILVAYALETPNEKR